MGILIDCDPGIDDAVALLWAVSSELELKGISTVAGNVEVEKTTKNAKRVLEFMGRRDIRIGMGLPRPLFRDLVTCPHVHGEDGLGNCGLPEPCLTHGFFLDLWREISEEDEVLCTGPLTNAAVASLLLPNLGKLKRMVVMGGALGMEEWGKGNVGSSEFNFYVDPEAVSVVLHSEIVPVLVPLDVTMDPSLRITSDFLERMIPRTRVAELALKLLRFQVERLGETYVHDAVALYYLLNPGAFQTIELRVSLGKRGEVFIDPNGFEVLVCRRVTAESFWRDFMDALGFVRR